jgi:non-ribosomal peptide synthetase component F
MLPLRTDLSGNPTFRELLTQVRERAMEAFAHQDIPFEKLVDVLQPERDVKRKPLVQVVFSLQNTPTSYIKLPNLTLHSLDINIGTAMFDLTLAMHSKGRELSGVMHYSSDLFNAVRITQMLDHYQKVLEIIVKQPDCRLLDIPVLSGDESMAFARSANVLHRYGAERFNLQ